MGSGYRRMRLSDGSRTIGPTVRPTPRYLRSTEAGRYLGVSKGFLEKLRMVGGGPKFLKLGRKVAYERQALDAWLDARRLEVTPRVNRKPRRTRPGAAPGH